MKWVGVRLEQCMENWYIVTGCERLSPGCDNCPTYWDYYHRGLDYHPIFHKERIMHPYKFWDGTTVIVAPGSDLIHEAITEKQIRGVVNVMKHNPEVFFEVGTKRAERLVALGIKWPDNVTVGVAVEEARYKWRIDALRDVDVQHKMVSFGPLTGPVGEIDMCNISMAGVVVETWGPNPRPVKQEWIDEIRDQCLDWPVRFVDQHWVAKETV